MKRCLILSCSQTKRPDAGELPAVERYDGPAFRVWRKFVREGPPERQPVDLFVLSAQYGLIAGGHPVTDYDQRMTRQRAAQLREQVCAAFRAQIAEGGYDQVFLSLGRDYLAALAGCEMPAGVQVSRASSGARLSELKAWLYGQPVSPPAQEPPAAVEPARGWAVIRGARIEMTAEEVLAAARQALAQGPGDVSRHRWYVQVDEQRVGPKWLVSVLTGLPVRAFVADEARRALRQLGIEVQRNE